MTYSHPLHSRLSPASMFATLAVLMAVSAPPLRAQQAAPANSIVPPLVNFNGTLNDANGKPLTGTVAVTFSLYSEQTGGAALWMESQSVQPDNTGHYTVTLGSTSSTGLPATIFTAGQAHWMGVQAQGEQEQPRVLLVAVPYALKAGDAQTLGGLPASAFVLAAPPTGGMNALGDASTANAASVAASSQQTSSDVTTSGGTVGYIPLWDAVSDIASSAITQTGSGSTAKVGINNTTPATSLDVKGGGTVRGPLTLPQTGTATASKGYNSQPIKQTATSYNSTSGEAITQNFQWQAEPSGNDTSNPSGTLNLLYASGSSTPVETGLNIAANGQITFASGQAFPGTATLESNTFSGAQTITVAQGSPPLQVTSTTMAPNLNANFLGGLTAGEFAQTGLSNIFSQNQTVNANLTATNVTATQSVSAGGYVNATSGFELGGTVFDWGSVSLGNASLGFGGNLYTVAAGNTGVGYQALFSNIGDFGDGDYNTAIGHDALYSTNENFGTGTGLASFNSAVGHSALYYNTTGSENTAVGDDAGLPTTTGTALTGNNNTFLGYGTSYSSATLTNSTAIGAYAEVVPNNAIVLGPISGTNNCTAANNCASVNVGIGTTSPQYTLHVLDNGSGGITGFSNVAGHSAVYGQNTANSGTGTNGGTFYTSSSQGSGIVAVNNASDSLAGWFGGNVYISGSLSKGSGSFKIDHPLDPANKYLYHSFVESPDMMNIYNGVTQMDAHGAAWITLPDYFQALNRDFRYQLTSIGRAQPNLYIAREISGNRFRIAGGKPGGKVSWQVTGIRHDAYAEAHRIQVEEEKPENERGHYLHPELFGAPPEQAIGYQAPPAPPKPPIEAESAPKELSKAGPALR